MNAIEEMRKVIEPGINYISLLKAQMTKYKSKKMVGGKWVYKYDEPGKAREKKAEPDVIKEKSKEILGKLKEMEKYFVDVIVAKKVENEKKLSQKFKSGEITTKERHQKRGEFAKTLEDMERKKLNSLNLDGGLFNLYKDEPESDAFAYSMREATGKLK